MIVKCERKRRSEKNSKIFFPENWKWIVAFKEMKQILSRESRRKPEAFSGMDSVCLRRLIYYPPKWRCSERIGDMNLEFEKEF